MCVKQRVNNPDYAALWIKHMFIIRIDDVNSDGKNFRV